MNDDTCTERSCLSRDIIEFTSKDPCKLSAAEKFVSEFKPDVEDISSALYEHLFVQDRIEFIKWLLSRYAGINVFDDGELESYQKLVEKMKLLPRSGIMNVNGKDIPIIDLSEIGYEACFLYTSYYILANDFALNQYHHEHIHPYAGDVLIDAGAYTGDTALMFALNTGFKCHTHSFEISEANIRAYHANCTLNPGLSELCTINKYALSDISGTEVYFDEGDYEGDVFSAFKVSSKKNGICIQTLTIDDYVSEKKLNSVDFIKMDIEGAEQAALKGAVNTIRIFKPRMALSLYHLKSDLTEIPRIIHAVNSNYRFGFKWCNKILKNEAVLFAIDMADLSEID